MKEIKEAEVISEKTIEKPEIIVPEAQIKGTTEITNNIKDVKESAIALNEYYSKLIITEDNLSEAKTEKAKVNKFKDEVASYRKNIIAEYKKPIDEFESLAKETESILKETYELINTQCDKYDQAKKDTKINEAKEYLAELCKAKEIPFEISFEQIGIKVGTSISDKKIREGIDVFIENIESELVTINTMEHKEEILVEYQKDLNLPRAIKEVNDRYEAMKKLQESEKKEETPTESETTILQAPKEVDEVLGKAIFKVVASRDKLKKLVGFMKEEGIEYEQLKQ